MVANQFSRDDGGVVGPAPPPRNTQPLPLPAGQEHTDKVLTLETTNPHILAFRKMEYAARGPIIMRAMELDRELAQAKKVLLFSFLIWINKK